MQNQAGRKIGMNSKLRVLHLEDSPADAELFVPTLRTGTLSVFGRGENKDHFTKQLSEGQFDVILSDYGAGRLRWLSALSWSAIRNRNPIHFDSETGARRGGGKSLRPHDYILKNRLTRLVPPCVVRSKTPEKSELEKAEPAFFVHKTGEHRSAGQRIAHDLNNILAPIMMSAFPCCAGLGSRRRWRKRGFSIETSAQRGADLVKQLLLFGRAWKQSNRAATKH